MYNFVFIELYLCYNLKANHNKDYSVVKTFKVAPVIRGRFFYAVASLFC